MKSLNYLSIINVRFLSYYLFKNLFPFIFVIFFVSFDPIDALQSVAARFLISSNLNLSEDIEKSLIILFQYIHQSIEKATIDFLNIMRRKFYVTPTSYLELLSTYNKVIISLILSQMLFL